MKIEIECSELNEFKLVVNRQVQFFFFLNKKVKMHKDSRWYAWNAIKVADLKDIIDNNLADTGSLKLYTDDECRVFYQKNILIEDPESKTHEIYIIKKETIEEALIVAKLESC